MISRMTEIYEFSQIRLILEAKFRGDALVIGGIQLTLFFTLLLKYFLIPLMPF